MGEEPSSIVTDLGVGDRTVGQPLGQNKRSSLEVARKVRHLSFLALQKLHNEKMVYGLPAIEGMNKLCDRCLIGKQKRTSFPSQASNRVSEPLELVHGDLGGPIKPMTPDGKTLFLLLVDDKSRFMWLILLQAKSEAVEAIKCIQARAWRPNAGRRCECYARTPHKIIPNRVRLLFQNTQYT